MHERHARDRAFTADSHRKKLALNFTAMRCDKILSVLRFSACLSL